MWLSLQAWLLTRACNWLRNNRKTRKTSLLNKWQGNKNHIHTPTHTHTHTVCQLMEYVVEKNKAENVSRGVLPCYRGQGRKAHGEGNCEQRLKEGRAWAMRLCWRRTPQEHGRAFQRMEVAICLLSTLISTHMVSERKGEKGSHRR